ncbi:MAG: glycoside hydrolase family 16 protein, partial [Sphingomonas sp.]
MMSLLTLMAAQATTLAATNYTVDVPMHAPSAAPSWADEFDGTRVDPATWRFDTAYNASGWFNHELQYYADARPENTRIEHGLLVIEARH